LEVSAIAREKTAAPAQSRRLTVVIADDHPLMLAGIRRALERDESIEVVGEARSGPEVLDVIERSRPKVVLTDLQMPGTTGSELIEQIHTSWPEVRIVVLSVSDDQASINRSLEAGASAYIVKTAIPTEIAPVLSQAASGTVFQRVLCGTPAGNHAPESELAEVDLTERERTVLESIAAGMTTSAISRELCVSEHTVKFHLTNIYRKLGVPNRTAAVRYAIENHLVAP
jgi:DNA-binding NarL/FixJ family response regulator